MNRIVKRKDIKMEFNQIIELIKTISDSKVTSFTLEEGDKKLTIKAGDSKQPQIVQIPPMPPISTMPPMQAPAVAPMIQPVAPVAGAPIAEAALVQQAAEIEEDKNVKTVTSPLVGTFYSAPSPEAEPFVRVGDTVKKGQVVGIVEAMKLMNEIECEHDGVITEIMVNNGDMVEYGQVLIKVK